MMNKLLKIILNISRSLAVPVFNFLIAIIGINYLGKENWGDFIQILLWIYVVVFIANFGNKDWLLREYSKNPSKIYEQFSIAFVSRSVFLTLSLILLFFFSPKLALISILLSVTIYFYQSLESLVIYKQQFLAQLIAEIIGFILISSFIFYYKNNPKKETLLLLYSIAFLLKFMIVFWALKIDLKQTKFQFSKAQLKQLLPFFLIGFSGWLSSKVDLYVVNSYFTDDKSQLAEYQLLITAFLMLQAFSAMIIYPFSKHLFRLPEKAIKKIKRLLIVVSFPLVIIGSFSIWYVFEIMLALNIDRELYIVGGLASFPIYFFIIDIIIFYKNKNERKVMYINFFAAIFKFVLSLILISNYGVLGVLMTVLISNYLLLVLYKTKLPI